MPDSTQFPEIAKKVIDDVLIDYTQNETKEPRKLSSVVMREVYRSLLLNLLGAEILKPLEQYINKTTFPPPTRLLYVDGLMYAFGLRTPALFPIRDLIEMFYFKGHRHMRKVARQLEDLVFNYSIPKSGSWFSTLLELKASGELSSAQFRGEIKSILVSAYSLSSAIVSTLLCLAARPKYIEKIRENPAFAHFFVEEVLRLYPPFRQFGYEQKGIWDKKQFSKRKTTNFFILTYGLHRNPRFWPKPNEFYPERFLKPSTGKSCTFLPFGVGHRDCIGRTYSMNMLIALLQYACSEECGLELLLPDDFIADSRGMPIGLIGRLVSFPVDDRIYLSRSKSPHRVG